LAKEISLDSIRRRDFDALFANDGVLETAAATPATTTPYIKSG
jgi:hypothetical protein